MRLGGIGRAAVGVLCLVAAAASGQTLTRGPFIQNPQALPTSATFVWWTDVVGDSTVEYGLTPGLGSSLTVAQAASCDVGTAGTCHSVTLTGLTPGTLYYYRLKTNGGVVQNTTYFSTLRGPSDSGDLYFTVIGDWGQGTTGEAQIAALQDAANPPMIITVGDNSYPNGTQSELDNNAMAYYQSPLQRAFYFPTLGNHDLNNVGGASGWASSAHIKTFVLPTNSPEPERYYWWEDGDALFISLDSDGCCSATQTNWLNNLLSTSPRKWKFVFYHHTAYSCANGIASLGSDTNIRNTWGPIWERNQVDIVFHGHDHIYERTKFMDEYNTAGGAGSDGLGTTYVMSGGGGATLDQDAKIDGSGPYRQPFFFSPRENCYWLSQTCPSGPGGYCSYDRYQYTSVVISGDVLTLQAIDSTGAVFDTLTIDKSVAEDTPTPTATPLPPTATNTATPVSTVTDTPSRTATATATDTPTEVDSPTPTVTSSRTFTATPTVTSTFTATPANTPTNTATFTRTATRTATNTPLNTATRTNTPTRTNTGTATATRTETAPSSPTATPTPLCGSGVQIIARRFDVAHNAAPAGDELVKLRGEFTLTQLSPVLDPPLRGFTLTVLDSATGATIFSRYVPPGLTSGGGAPGWRIGGSGWKYTDKTGAAAGGITKVIIKQRAPGQLKFKVLGRDNTFQVPPPSPSITVIVVPGDSANAAAGQCATGVFNADGGPLPTCKFLAGGDRVKCK